MFKVTKSPLVMAFQIPLHVNILYCWLLSDVQGYQISSCNGFSNTIARQYFVVLISFMMFMVTKSPLVMAFQIPLHVNIL